MSEKPGIRLPPYVFLVGPRGCGKTTLAQLICEKNHRVAMAGFEEPIREATLAIFFPEQLHLGIDLRRPEVQQLSLPYTTHPAGRFMKSLRSTLTQMSPTLVGDLAKKRASYIIGMEYDHVIFDDSDGPDDLRPFILAYGPQSVLIILIERLGMPMPPFLRSYDNVLVPKMLITNPEGKPEAMLQRLQELRPVPEEDYHVQVQEAPRSEPSLSDL